MQQTHEAYDILIAAFILASQRLIKLYSDMFIIIKPREELTEIDHIYG